jgi:hypothetical protein
MQGAVFFQVGTAAQPVRAASEELGYDCSRQPCCEGLFATVSALFSSPDNICDSVIPSALEIFARFVKL